MTNWVESAVFYHVYPLGFFGCEQYAVDEIHHRLPVFKNWIPHLQSLHVNALYWGPVFSSYEHGYDTSDYHLIDPRLGTNDDFQQVCKQLKKAGIRIVLDGVFNHVGRNFWAFQDVLQKQEASPYADWFHIRFHQQAPWGDPFTYETWEGHPNLIKLNLRNEAVVQHLLSAVEMWMDEFQIDGLRLDAADCIHPDFFKRLKAFCKQKNPNFWLMGEIIHGDYTRWANPEMLDSVTNYECYKGLYSSHNEKNYFEIAYSLNRQFGSGGIYKDLHLYNFVDNHDVNRIASVIHQQDNLKSIFTMLYAMPGIPSIYYGSEYAMQGIKHDGSDADIRPCLVDQTLHPIPLTKHLQQLGALYEKYEVFYHGDYQQVLITNEQFVFSRTFHDTTLYAVFNVSDDVKAITFKTASNHIKLIWGQTDFHIHEHQLEMKAAPHESYLFITAAKSAQTESKPSDTASQQETILSDTIQIGRYRHFKGKEYAVLYLAKHSETLEDYVVYRQLYGEEKVWVRPANMFLETVEYHGKKQPRFQYIGK